MPNALNASFWSGFSLLTLTAALAPSAYALEPFFYWPSTEMTIQPKDFPDFPPESLDIESLDGRKINLWYFSSTTPNPKGVVIHFHGNAQNMSTHFVRLYWLQRRGYDLLEFDYHGFGKSEGNPNPENTAEDGIAILRWVQARKPDLPKIVFADSLGGAVATESIARTRGEVPLHGLFVESTFHSYLAIAEQKADLIGMPVHWLLRLLLGSYADIPSKFIPELSPLPLVVSHGKNDPAVPYELGQKYFELVQGPKEWWELAPKVHAPLPDHAKVEAKLEEMLAGPAY